MIYMTPQGAKELSDRIEDAERRLAEIRAEKAIAYHLSGDTWHDNPGFNQLEQQETQQAETITLWRTQLSEATIVDPDPPNTSRVTIGSIVRFEATNEGTGEMKRYLCRIVGFGEGDPTRLEISYNSPIGRGIMRLVPGDEREISDERGKFSYRVLLLYPNWEDATKTV